MKAQRSPVGTTEHQPSLRDSFARPIATPSIEMLGYCRFDPTGRNGFPPTPSTSVGAE
jgi:hypothetical protein